MPKHAGWRWIVVAVLGFAACTPRLDSTRPPLRVGTTGDYVPFSVPGPQGMTGFDVEVARRFAADTGRRLELVPFRWVDLLASVLADRFDVAMGGVTMRADRALVGTFTRPVVHTGAALLVRGGLATRPDDVDRRGVRLAVNGGGHMERLARRLFANTIITATSENGILPKLVATGNVDAALCDEIEARLWVGGIEGGRVLGPFTVDHKAYLARDPALAAELDAWLRAHEDDGSLAELRLAWFGPEHEGRRNAFESDVDALLALVDLRLGFMPWVAAAKVAAGWPIADPAQEARVLAAARDEAAARGLDAGTYAALASAMIAASRAVQAEFLALGPERRTATEVLDLDRVLRPGLAGVSRAIAARAADVAGTPALAALEPGGLVQFLDPSLTPADDRRAIATAIVGLRRAR